MARASESLERGANGMSSFPEWNRDWDLAPAFVPKARYLSPEFARVEAERLWPRVWQVACREDELAEPGCCVEYEIGDESILLVRTDVRQIKAFFNDIDLPVIENQIDRHIRIGIHIGFEARRDMAKTE